MKTLPILRNVAATTRASSESLQAVILPCDLESYPEDSSCGINPSWDTDDKNKSLLALFVQSRLSYNDVRGFHSTAGRDHDTP